MTFDMTMMTLGLGCKMASTRRSKCCSLHQVSGNALDIDLDGDAKLKSLLIG